MTPARPIARHPPPRTGFARARSVSAWPARVRAPAAAMLGIAGGLVIGLAILVEAPSVGGGSPAGSAASTLAAPPESVASVIAPAGATALMSTPNREEDGP